MAPVIGIIPARFGSTRLPGKPLSLILGKPLIQHTYENAREAKCLDRLLVATDHPEIQHTVEAFGGEAVMTATHHQTGTDRIAEVVEESLDGAKGSIIVNIQGDWPCLDPKIIDAAVKSLKADWGADMGTVAIPFENPEDLANPAKVKCLIDQRGRAIYFTRNGATKGAYYHLGIYSYRADFLLRFAQLPPGPLELHENLEQLRALEHGYAIKVEIVNHANVLSVDTPEDITTIEGHLCLSSSSSQEASAPPLAKV